MSSMWIIPLPMVLATAVPKTNAAMKFQKAAQATARNGVRTRVETTVAMELAASCQPFENSHASVSATTGSRSEKLVTGASLASVGIEVDRGHKGNWSFRAKRGISLAVWA